MSDTAEKTTDTAGAPEAEVDALIAGLDHVRNFFG